MSGIQIHGGDCYTENGFEKGLCDFSVNLSPLGLPGKVKEVLSKGFEEAIRYPDSDCRKLRLAISKKEEVDKEYIMCGNGASDLLYILARAKHPKSIGVISPTFSEYENSVWGMDCEVVKIPALKINKFRYKEKDIQITLEKGLDILYLCNPNNPTGTLEDRKTLESILKLCEKEGTLLVVDECFLDFVKDGENCSMKPFIGHPNLLLLKAFTKRYAMAGVRLGYILCGNKQLLNHMKKATQPWNVSGVAQAAGIAALKEQDYEKNLDRLIESEKRKMIDGFQKLGFQIYGSKANYIFFYTKLGRRLWEDGKRAGFYLRDCSGYDGLGPGYYRVGIKTKEENERLLSWLNQL